MTEKEIREVSRRIYDILVEDAGAPSRPDDYDSFFYWISGDHAVEYRFGGHLGFGGKFWINAGKWYITTYPEYEKEYPVATQIINKTNTRLAALRSEVIGSIGSD